MPNHGSPERRPYEPVERDVAAAQPFDPVAFAKRLEAARAQREQALARRREAAGDPASAQAVEPAPPPARRRFDAAQPARAPQPVPAPPEPLVAPPRRATPRRNDGARRVATVAAMLLVLGAGTALTFSPELRRGAVEQLSDAPGADQVASVLAVDLAPPSVDVAPADPAIQPVAARAIVPVASPRPAPPLRDPAATATRALPRLPHPAAPSLEAPVAPGAPQVFRQSPVAKTAVAFAPEPAPAAASVAPARPPAVERPLAAVVTGPEAPATAAAADPAPPVAMADAPAAAGARPDVQAAAGSPRPRAARPEAPAAAADPAPPVATTDAPVAGGVRPDGPAAAALERDLRDPGAGGEAAKPESEPAATSPAGVAIAVHAPPSLSDAALAETLAELGAAGFEATHGVRVGMAIGRTHVRYFHAVDAPAAQRLARALVGGGRAEVRDFTHFAPRPAPGRLEIWLSGDARSSARAAPSADPAPPAMPLPAAAPVRAAPAGATSQTPAAAAPARSGPAVVIGRPPSAEPARPKRTPFLQRLLGRAALEPPRDAGETRSAVLPVGGRPNGALDPERLQDLVRVAGGDWAEAPRATRDKTPGLDAAAPGPPPLQR